MSKSGEVSGLGARPLGGQHAGVFSENSPGAALRALGESGSVCRHGGLLVRSLKHAEPPGRGDPGPSRTQPRAGGRWELQCGAHRWPRRIGFSLQVGDPTPPAELGRLCLNLSSSFPFSGPVFLWGLGAFE